MTILPIFLTNTSEIGHIQYFRKQLTDIEIVRVIEATDQGESHMSIRKSSNHRNSFKHINH